ncbi:digestive organ expansion factor homolog isoform X1 [Dendrobium catenatum]|uniref:digestive organ expansion factor homolog isoform X1 n=3 Tax=Dendrobium catenatum TaxID=906689 RepID=UPI0009F2C862|nr:digestive organ expansion factor homolog isoform X1 [Dendrobium catenatum]
MYPDDAARKRGRSDAANGNDNVPSPKRSKEMESNQSGLGSELKPCSKFFSCFQRHFGHVLTSEEVDKLTKDKLKLEWKMHVKEMTMSKLVGTGQDLSMELNGDPFCGVNQKLYNHWKNLDCSSNFEDSCLSKRRLFFSLCNTYRDIMHCNKRPFYLKGKEDDSSIMDAYIMHALNHIHSIRENVLKNDAKLNKDENSKSEEIHCGEFYLDQGFTRPKVMLLLPLASIAFRVVKRLVQLSSLSHKGNVAYMDRFSEEFGAGDVLGDDKNIDGNLASQKRAKPVDFQTLFGGNHNDHFMMGIKLTKRSIKLYSNFYSSDIIVASPLGLVTKIGETEFEKEKDIDYLSSIEVLIIDHADVITMQNWSHVNTVIEHLNHLPSKQHGTDVMRIKPWYLEGHARFYRQTIILGYLVTPEMNALFNRLCVNYEGKLKLISKHKGVLHKVLLQVRQAYERFEASSIIDTDDARLEYFSKKVFPKMKDSLEGGTLVFISSYFEFVRIRNFLKSQNASFCLLGEYTKQSDVSRSRLWFFEGKRKIMLYTERAHFYHRYKIRGIKNLIIYSLPERKEFYPEIVNMLEGSKNMSCSVLFSRFDLYRLERIVGTAAAKKMSSSDKTTFVFC